MTVSFIGYQPENKQVIITWNLIICDIFLESFNLALSINFDMEDVGIIGKNTKASTKGQI